MNFRQCLIATLVLLHGPALGQPLIKNLPGCGPAQEALYNEGMAGRQAAYDATVPAERELAKELVTLTDRFAGLACGGGPAAQTGQCKSLATSIKVAREARADNNKAQVTAAAALNAYRTQQPFVSPTGEACIRCKEAGPWNCPNPGGAPGFKPPLLRPAEDSGPRRGTSGPSHVRHHQPAYMPEVRYRRGSSYTQRNWTRAIQSHRTSNYTGQRRGSVMRSSRGGRGRGRR